MKKVININFQGRVIPIEETAFENLNEYIESLRVYFANEEGKEEIINDIESRIAELFSEELKKGSSCITDQDVEKIISGMGRPADFEAEEADSTSGSKTYASTSETGEQTYRESAPAGRGRLYRNADDKILGGVCSGLANYIGIDPVVLRIVFLVFFGALFWVYILLWIIVPSKSMESNITRRLYRNPDGKVIGGVAGGLAAYFNIDPWIPRLIFAFPFLLALISGTFGTFAWWGWEPGFFVSGSIGSTMFLTYLVLWIAVPLATTASEKLEMRGEKINLNSIKNTVQEDLGSFRQRAERFSGEVRESASEFGEKARNVSHEAGERMKSFATETAPVVKRAGRGLGNVIGILFKAFFLFIAGVLAIALFAVFVSFLFGSYAIYPLKDFFLDGFTENLLVWLSLILVLGLPVIAIITWIIRRIVGVRSNNNYLGYVFGTLWIIGIIALIALIGMVGQDFRVKVPIEQEVPVVSQGNDKVFVDVYRYDNRFYNSEWFGFDNNTDFPFKIYRDSMLLNSVRVNVRKSRDSSYRIYKVMSSRGSNSENAYRNAENINFDIRQNGNIISLPEGFPITKDDKFRNQQVMVIVEVPVGKKIELDHSIRNYVWMNINNNRSNWNFEFDDDWDDYPYRWRTGVEYIMTTSGLERTDDVKNNSNGIKRENNNNSDTPVIDNRYRYQPRISLNKTRRMELKESSVETRDEEEDYESSVRNSRLNSIEISTPLSVFSRMFQ